MTAEPMIGGIIAAGEGSRLRQAGFTMPKPLVPVAGVPLLEGVIRNFVAAGIRSLTVIVNETERDCVEWAAARFPTLDVRFIVRTTAGGTGAPPGWARTVLRRVPKPLPAAISWSLPMAPFSSASRTTKGTITCGAPGTAA